MCEPVTISMGVLAAAGAATSIMGQRSAQKANQSAEQAKKIAQDDLIMENRKRATKDYLREVRLDQLAQAQETESLGEKTADIGRQAEAAKGTAMASAAERGVAGRSVDTILADYDFQQNQEVGRLRINQAQTNSQHGETRDAALDQFDQRVSAVKPYVPRTQPPVDYFTPILGGLASTVQTGAAMKAFAPASSIAGQPVAQAAANQVNQNAWTSQVKV